MAPRWPDTVTPGSPIKASHVAGLRDAIANHHVLAFGNDYGWSWPNVTPGAAVLAKHFAEMRAAIQNLWNHKSRGPLPMWSSGVNPGGSSLGTSATVIRASDVTDLRHWLELYENNHPPQAQGIDTKSYEPEHVLKPVIGTSWAQDILNLSQQKPLFVRCNVKAQLNNAFTNDDIVRYETAFNEYQNVLGPKKVFAIFGEEFFRTDTAAHRAPLNDDPSQPFYTNSYIRDFAERAATLAAWFRDPAHGGVEDYIIWNEPNGWRGDYHAADLDEEHFAGLLYHCRERMTPDVRLYWGGIFTNLTSGYPAPLTNKPDEGNLRYISNVYKTLRDTWQLCGGDNGSWPWNGINLHVHRDRDEGFINDLFGEAEVYPGLPGVNGIRKEYGDSSELLIGEWGISVEDWRDRGASDPLGHLYGLLKDRADVMFFFAHHWVGEGPTNWGLHHYDESTLDLTGWTNYQSNPPQYNPDMQSLHESFDELIGG